MKQLALAFQFLTIIPVKVKGDVSAHDLSRSSVFFPVVGAFQGLLAACAVRILSVIFPVEITSGLVVVILILSNGGFHLDGLADTSDALAVKSCGDEEMDREKRLSVMKDSSTGAIGVIAIVLAILLKFLFVKNLVINTPAPLLPSLLFLMPVYSRWVMVPALCHGTSARKDGLGNIFAGSVGAGTVVTSFLFVTLFCLLALSFSGGLYMIRALTLYLSLSALLYLFSLLAVLFFRRKFGGLTGDNFGAISEISEILFLVVTTLWLQHSI